MNSSFMMGDDTILSRISKLNQQIVGKCTTENALLSREGLLDAIFVLYKECNNDHLIKNKYVADFVHKFTPLVKDLRKTRIGLEDFEIQSIIGRGHFGEVEVVREKQTGDVFAMKTLRKHDTLAQENAAFYEEERDIMAKSNSPWITQLQYAFQDNDMLYLVMEFHPGGDLLSLLGRYDDMLDESMASFYLAEMVLAINSLHTMGYVHRDIKPENILIDRTGHIKLADFGSAAKLNASKMVTSKMPVGTPDYVSPELLIAMNSTNGLGSYSVEVDWWSLGICAYEMLYGVTPFADDSNSMVATYSNIMNYKKSLVFQPTIPTSSDAKSFIKGLLTGVTDRMGFEELRLHKFFDSIDFDTIRMSKPPFIPSITSLDDTSNFEAFEKEKPQAVSDDTKSRTEFSGKDLPFVGFTYAKAASAGLDRSIMPDIFSPVKNNNLEQKLLSKAKEVQCLKEKCHQQETASSQLERENSRLKSDLKSNNEKLMKVIAERDILERDMTSYIAETSSLKRQLDLEMNEKQSTDDKAMQLLQDICQQQKVAKQLREENYRAELEEHVLKIVQLEEENSTLTKKLEMAERDLQNRGCELKSAMSKVDTLSGKMSKIKSDRRTSCVALKVELAQDQEHYEATVKDMQDKLDKLSVKNRDLTNLFRDTRKDKARLEQELKSLKNGEVSENIPALKKKLTDLETQHTKDEEELKNLRKAEMKIIQIEIDLDEKTTSYKEASEKITELEEKLQAVEASTKRHARMSSHKTDQLEETVTELKAELKKLQEEKDKVETTYRDLYEKKEKTKIKDIKKELEAKLKSAEESTKQHEKISSHKTDQLEETVKELKAELKKLQEEKEKIDYTSRDIYEKREKTKMDELKKKKDDCDKRVKETRDKQHALEMSLAEEKEKSASLLAKLEKEKKSSQETITKLERANTGITHQLTELKDSCSVVNDLEKDIEELAEKYNAVLLEKKELEAKYEQALAENTDEEDIQILIDSLAEKKRLVEHQDQKMKHYKTIIDEMEAQLEDLEKLVEVYEDKEKQWFNAKKEFEKAACNVDSHIDATARKLEEEKQARSHLDKKVLTLTKTLENERTSHKLEKDSLNKKLKEQTTKLNIFNDQLSQVEKEKGLVELKMKNVERKLDTESDGVNSLKEEISKWKTNAKSLKDTNFKLSQGLEEALDNCETMKIEKQDLEATVENIQMVYQNEKYKLESTLSQQTKLIDYLQAKGDTPAPKKKKTIFGTPAKPKDAEAPKGMPAPSWKDLQHSLDMERARNKRLNDQMTDLRAELHSAKTDSIKLGAFRMSFSSSTESLPMVSAPSSPKRKVTSSNYLTPAKTSGSQVPLLTPREPAKQMRRMGSGAEPTEVYTPNIPRIKKSRIQHDVPHKFITGVNTRATKCAVCLGAVSFVKCASKCQECNVVCHPKCAPQAPSMCGLPTEYMTQFTEMMNKTATTSAVTLPTMELGIDLGGWMKIPRSGKQTWERRYIQLEDSVLNVYNREDCNGTPVDEFDLCPIDGNVTVHSGVTATELNNVSPSDLPFILRLESRPFTTCWPGRTMYLMAPSFSDKQKWVAYLETITSYTDTKTNEQQAKLLGNMLLSVSGGSKMDVNCSVLLSDQLLLIGAEEGLYALELLKKDCTPIPLYVNGLSGVYQMELLPEAGHLLLITGKDRKLIKIGLSVLMTHANQSRVSQKAKISVSSVEKIVGCTVFTSGCVANVPYVVAAQPHTLLIIKYNEGEGEFDIRKEITTTDSCSCLHITSEDVIIGTDKYHRINLHTYEITEFLDKKDSSLAFAAFGAAQFNSFPIAVLRVTDSPREFLLCFHEFGVFVDSNGRRSRDEDLKWSGMPLSFALREPYLFVTHFNALQVIEIPPLSSKAGRGAQTSVSIINPRYLGPAVSKGAVYIASVQSDCVEVMCFKGNLTNTDKENVQRTHSQRRRSPTKIGSKRGFVSPVHSPMKIDTYHSSPYNKQTICSPVSPFPKRAVNKKVRYSDSSETDV